MNATQSADSWGVTPAAVPAFPPPENAATTRRSRVGEAENAGTRSAGTPGRAGSPPQAENGGARRPRVSGLTDPAPAR